MKRKTDNFNKFYNKKNNAAIKEGFRQEKKAAKKERKEAIERRFEERRQARGFSPDNNTDKDATRGNPRFGKPHPGIPAKGPFGKGPESKSHFAKGPASKGPESKSHFAKKSESRDPESKGHFAKGPASNGPAARGYAPKDQPSKGPGSKGPAPIKDPNPIQGKGGSQNPTPKGHTGKEGGGNHAEQLPLNKYIAHGGICSRRDAADLIRAGKVTVNGKPVNEPGTKVLPTDLVKVNGKKITISKNFVYILLNKPKDYLTTMDDPQGRRTVIDLIRAATTERVYPVGRLDRNTSGVLLLTNDGDLAQKLAHPSHEIKKVYHVTLDKALTKGDFDKIVGGVTLEDGPAHVDVLAYADAKDRSQVGLEIHSGRNRIVRRIFEHLGYDVRGLDRVMYAGLTKKNVQRGMWRLLSEKEIRILKYLNSSIKGSAARAKEWAAAEAIAVADRPQPKAKVPAAIPATDEAAGTRPPTPRSAQTKRPFKASGPSRSHAPSNHEGSKRPAKPGFQPRSAGAKPGYQGRTEGERSAGEKPSYQGKTAEGRSAEGKTSYRARSTEAKPSYPARTSPGGARPAGASARPRGAKIGRAHV